MTEHSLDQYSRETDLLALAREIIPSLKERSRIIDEQSQFPLENLALLRQTGLMGLLVPENYGGYGASITTLTQVAQILAGGCLSTAMIWAMHLQQVACLADYANESLKARLLPHVAEGKVFIASVTTERGKGGHLLTAMAPLDYQDGQVLISREAPTCTGGAYGDGYLLTMRKDAQAPPSDVVLLYAERNQLEVTLQSGWDALGMRGTQSVALTLTGKVPPDQVLHAEGNFTQIALTTMVPIGHLVWAACWLGAIKEAFRDVQRLLRDPRTRKEFPVQSDLFLEKWSRIRMQIDIVNAYLEKTTRDYEQMRSTGNIQTLYTSAAYNIQINNLKVFASEQLFETVNQLMQLVGMRYAYLKNDLVSLERTMRDLRSASLMYANDRLLLANGALALFDHI